MTPEEFVQRLEFAARENGVSFARMQVLAKAEAQYGEEMAKFRGFSSLSRAAKCFFLRTVEQVNDSVRPAFTAAVNGEFLIFVEKLTYSQQSLRAAEVAALGGYPMQGYTILRNVFDTCTLVSGALQGLTDFTRLAGIRPGEGFDPEKAKRNRKEEEFAVRRQIDGKDSSLAEATLAQLKLIDQLFDTETHSALLSHAHSLDWLKGTGPLPVVPSYQETKAALFMNRFVEVGWLLHRILPLVQPQGYRLSDEWANDWDTIDTCYRAAVQSLTKQLGLAIGAAFCDFVDMKFPFGSGSQFPS